MVKEIKTSNAEKCDERSWGRRGLGERGEQTKRSGLGDTVSAPAEIIWKLLSLRDQVSGLLQLGSK